MRPRLTTPADVDRTRREGRSVNLLPGSRPAPGRSCPPMRRAQCPLLSGSVRIVVGARGRRGKRVASRWHAGTCTQSHQPRQEATHRSLELVVGGSIPPGAPPRCLRGQRLRVHRGGLARRSARRCATFVPRFMSAHGRTGGHCGARAVCSCPAESGRPPGPDATAKRRVRNRLSIAPHVDR